MHLNVKFRVARNWGQILDGYLELSDQFFIVAQRCVQRMIKIFKDKSMSSGMTLFKITLAALILVFLCVLVSCKTTRRSVRQGQQENPTRRAEKKPESLYTKRQVTKISPQETGSKTGSIWADAQQPRQLFADARPSRQGELVTVHIPDELQFRKNGPAAVEKSKPTPNAKASAKKPSETENSLDKALASREAGVVNEIQNTPVEAFKMEIVGLEATGDVYLRGKKNFRNSLGENHNLLVFAKLPRRALVGFDVDARELTEVALNEEANGQIADYAAPGWDQIVSRKLSGYSPDIDAELASLEDVRSQLQIEKVALKDQAKALSEERERLRKERNRVKPRDSSPQAQPTPENSTPANAPTAPGTNPPPPPPASGSTK